LQLAVHFVCSAGNIKEQRETDRKRIEQRLKQIAFGKNTLGYANYLKAVPKCVSRMQLL
jgi:uncharacterized phage protein gp47/JayE